MKRLELKYFENIEDAYRDGSAASCNWADARVREIQDYLINKNVFEIITGDNITLINGINDLIEWKKDKNLPSLSFGIKIDNIKLIDKLNVNINRYQVRKLTITASVSEFSKMMNLNFSLASEDGSSFYAGFKDVSYTSLAKNTTIELSELKCRLAYSNEINELKSKVNIEGKICIALTYKKLNSNNTDIIVCRKLEN